MLGLFGSLNVGARSLQAQQTGVEVAGHNLANVNNPAYRRQRLEVESAITLPTTIGSQGTGVTARGIRQITDALLDARIESEISVSGFYEAQQRALQNAQSALGQEIDRQASGPEGASASQGLAGQYGIAQGLNSFFNSFQSVAASPSSLAERQVLLLKADALATQFNQAGERLDTLRDSLNETIASDAAAANDLLAGIAELNDEIDSIENSTGAPANDLRDARQAKLEELAKLVEFDTSQNASGTINITIGGETVVNGRDVADTLEAYDAGSGRTLIRLQTAGTPLALTGGTIQGAIEARDVPLAALRQELDTLAAAIIAEVNALHAGGFSLNGSTGAFFFTGTDALGIRVNSVLVGNPAAIQASGVNGAAGDNQIALAIAQLGTERIGSLSSQTFSESFGETVAELGQELATLNGQTATQEVVESMLRRQRDSVSGVSMDEEMTDLMRYQRAYQASARFINTIDELLQTVLSLK